MLYLDLTITKHLQDGFRIEWGEDVHRVIYIDPFKLADGLPKADAIFITHEHFDHCDQGSILKILKPETAVFGNAAVQKALEGIAMNDFREVTADSMTIPVFEGLEVRAIPAFNTNKFKQHEVVYHPSASGGVGFVLTFHLQSGSIAVYHMGDTDFVPESKPSEHIDVLMVPVSGTYVMTAAEAVVACNSIRPEVAIPMHYDAGIVGGEEDAQALKVGANCRVEVLAAE